MMTSPGVTMDPVHREVLDVNHAYLVAHLQAGDLTRTLLNDQIITNYDYEQMRRTEGQGLKAMNRLLLLTLRRRGGAAYAGLHKALRQVGQDDVCETLLDTELAIRDGLASDRLQENNRRNQHYTGQTLSLPPDDHEASLDAFLNRQPLPSSHRQSLPSPARSQSPRTQREGKEAMIHQLQQEVSDLRQSHSQMETDLRLQIERLEKEQKANGKKSGGCSIM